MSQESREDKITLSSGQYEVLRSNTKTLEKNGSAAIYYNKLDADVRYFKESLERLRKGDFSDFFNDTSVKKQSRNYNHRAPTISQAIIARHIICDYQQELDDTKIALESNLPFALGILSIKGINNAIKNFIYLGKVNENGEHISCSKIPMGSFTLTEKDKINQPFTASQIGDAVRLLGKQNEAGLNYTSTI